MIPCSSTAPASVSSAAAPAKTPNKSASSSGGAFRVGSNDEAAELAANRAKIRRDGQTFPVFWLANGFPLADLISTAAPAPSRPNAFGDEDTAQTGTHREMEMEDDAPAEKAPLSAGSDTPWDDSDAPLDDYPDLAFDMRIEQKTPSMPSASSATAAPKREAVGEAAAPVEPAVEARPEAVHNATEAAAVQTIVEATAPAIAPVKAAAQPEANSFENAPKTEVSAKSAPRAPETPKAPVRPEDIAPPEDPNKSAQVKNIALRMANEQGQEVLVRAGNATGQVKVEVRSSDSTLASTLREGVSELTRKLSEQGFRAQVDPEMRWKQAPAPDFNGVDERGNERQGSGGSSGQRQRNRSNGHEWESAIDGLNTGTPIA